MKLRNKTLESWSTWTTKPAKTPEGLRQQVQRGQLRLDRLGEAEHDALVQREKLNIPALSIDSPVRQKNSHRFGRIDIAREQTGAVLEELRKEEGRRTTNNILRRQVTGEGE